MTSVILKGVLHFVPLICVWEKLPRVLPLFGKFCKFANIGEHARIAWWRGIGVGIIHVI